MTVKRAYEASVRLVESLGRCAYEVYKMDGTYHVTLDPTGNSRECFGGLLSARQFAVTLNMSLYHIVNNHPGLLD